MTPDYAFDPAAIIGSRTMQSSTGKDVIVELCSPARMPDPPFDWFCAYRITGLDDDAIDGRVLGIDAIQALTLALVHVGDRLRTATTGLTFLGRNDLFLPTTPVPDPWAAR